MWYLLCESIIIGIITLIVGLILFNLTVNKKNKQNNYKTPHGIKFALFLTGIVIHLIIELSGFNKWICDKQTLTCQRVSMFS